MNHHNPRITRKIPPTAISMAAGITTGLVLGTALGNIAAGLAAGILIGAVGAMWKRRASLQ